MSMTSEIYVDNYIRTSNIYAEIYSIYRRQHKYYLNLPTTSNKYADVGYDTLHHLVIYFLPRFCFVSLVV